MPDELPCTTGVLNHDGLAALNRSPLSFLAACGVHHGAWFADSFLQAQTVLDHHGTSRRIDGDAARRLCLAMRSWAATSRS